jgi:hypothetical protein
MARADGGASTSDPPIVDQLRAWGALNLDADSPPDAVEAVLRSARDGLNGADPIRRQGIRSALVAELKRIKVPGATALVDAALSGPDGSASQDEDTGSGRSLTLADAEPWLEPVDGPGLMDELVKMVQRYVVLPDGGDTLAALWTVHTHAHAASRVSPILAAISPEKRCGKTTLLTLLLGMVRRPLPASNITSAALFRAVEKYQPTLLIDEADTFLRDREELRGVINSGHTRSTAVVIRTVGDDHEPRVFSTWAPKAIAMIDNGGTLPATIEDRSVVLTLRRRRPDEQVEELRLDRLESLAPLRSRIARWAVDHHDQLRHADPDVPGELHDRARDNWRPLLAIADAVGGPWPERARAAARTVSGNADDGDAPAVLLLIDLHGLFTERDVDRLRSEEVVEVLSEMEDRPWPEWKRGQPITVRQLARLLRPFEIRPKKIRFGDTTAQGYELEDMVDAFSRYIPRSDPEHPEQSSNDAENGAFPIRNNTNPVPDRKSAGKRWGTTDVPDVPDGEPPTMDLFGNLEADHG